MTMRGPAPTIGSSELSPLPGGYTVHDGAPTPTYPNNTLLVDRIFDDGYVRRDYWTGDDGLLETDNERYAMTWNWGVDDARQYQYAAGVPPTLSFHLSGNQAVMGPETLTGRGTDDDLPTDGVEVKFSRGLYTWTNRSATADDAAPGWTNGVTSLDLVLGIAWFPTVRQSMVRQARLGVYGVEETYTYLDYYGTSAGGLWPPLDVPYQGIFGDAYTAGPLIPERPESWDSTTVMLGTARERVTINTEIWRLRAAAGLTAGHELTRRLSTYLSPQVVLEFVDMRAERRELLTYTDALSGHVTTLHANGQSKHKMTLVPGFLLTAGADYLVSENWYLGASIGWEWLTYDPAIRVGQSHVRFNLDGGECSLYLGRHF
jgi:hypothetical protein